jgi:hypothetical protein
LTFQVFNSATLQIAGELLDMVGDAAFEIVQDLLSVRESRPILSCAQFIFHGTS